VFVQYILPSFVKVLINEGRDMLSDMDIFKIYGAMARHAADSQRVSAANVSRASEPGYKAMQVEPFGAFLERAAVDGSFSTPFRLQQTEGPSAPNGNSVNLEHEVFKSAEASGQHDMAMTVYSKTIELMRAAMGRQT